MARGANYQRYGHMNGNRTRRIAAIDKGGRVTPRESALRN